MAAMDLSARAAALVGTVLRQKWRLDEVLGIGGMATVFAATHRNQKRVAIKMLHPVYSLDPAVRDRFLREGYAANAVCHPGAVSVDDDDVAEDGSAFLVMELLEGESVEARLDRMGHRLPAPEVVAIIDQLLGVLAAAHEKGIVHRDVKPGNLFLTRRGALKVLDFGIAQILEPVAGWGAAAPERGAAGARATCAGAIMGTPAFMAPEQARARWELVDRQTDLWSVGATMFTLLSGRFVHEAETLNEQLGLAMMADARSIATVMPELPAPLVAFVDRATAYLKRQRFTDARTMQEALRRAWRAIAPTSESLVDPRESTARRSASDLERVLDPALARRPDPGRPPSDASPRSSFPGVEVESPTPNGESSAPNVDAADFAEQAPAPSPAADDSFAPEELRWRPRVSIGSVAIMVTAFVIGAAGLSLAMMPQPRRVITRAAHGVAGWIARTAPRAHASPGPVAPPPPLLGPASMSVGASEPAEPFPPPLAPSASSTSPAAGAAPSPAAPGPAASTETSAGARSPVTRAAPQTGPIGGRSGAPRRAGAASSFAAPPTAGSAAAPRTPGSPRSEVTRQ